MSETILYYFGVPWAPPDAGGPAIRVPTPAGVTCEMCHEPIQTDDWGFIYTPNGRAPVPTDKPQHAHCVLNDPDGPLGALGPVFASMAEGLLAKRRLK